MRRDIDIDLQLQQQGTRLLLHGTPIDDAKAARVAADKNVFRHRQVRAQIDFLVHGADAERLCVRGGARGHYLPVQRDAVAQGVNLRRAGAEGVRIDRDAVAPRQPRAVRQPAGGLQARGGNHLVGIEHLPAGGGDAVAGRAFRHA